MTRDEIRLRALRAAAAVSLTAGLLSCAAAIEVDADSETGGGGQGGETSGEDSSTSASTSASTSGSTSGDTPIEPDAGVDPEPEDAAPPMDATADAQVNCMQATDYAACCDQQNWAPEAGCMAWGPPMPPAMEVA